MSKHHGPEMLDQVDPRVRRLLISCRGRAMRGEPKQSDMMLREEIGRRVGSDNDQDVVALAMGRAELLYLDGCVEKAIEQFETHISPRIDRLEPMTRFVVEHNLIDLKIEHGGPIASAALSDFYHLYDRRMMVAPESSDYSNPATAWDAVEEENHREALAALWRDVVKSYREGHWGIHRAAMRRLGQEWLRIGDPADAAYCALLARDDKLARKVADDLLGRMDRALIDKVVAQILGVANLQRHFCVACEFLNQVGDAIADGQITAVAEWLQRASNTTQQKGRSRRS